MPACAPPCSTSSGLPPTASPAADPKTKKHAAPETVERLPREHHAERASDGTWSIYDVPIYAEETIRAPAADARGKIVFERNGAPKMRDYKIDRAWLEGTIATARRRGAGGYFSPAHVNHHDQETRPAGVFVPRRVATCELDGRRVATLFADFHRVPDDVFEEMRSGRLPYRSIEILDVRRTAGNAEIDSVAFMADRVPRFRFPNLRIAEEQRLDAAARPALAHYAAADGCSVAVVSRFDAEETMAATAPGTKAMDEKDTAAVKAKCAEACRTCVAAMKECAEAVKDSEPELAKRLEECVAICAECEEMLEGKETEQPGPAEPGPEEGLTAATQPAPASAVAAAAAAAFKATGRRKASSEQLALEARIAALEAQLATQARERDIEMSVKATADELEGEGYVIERPKLAELARSFGPVGLESFAQLLRSTPAAGPREGWDADLAREKPRGDAPEVVAYAAAGPNMLTEARHLAALYESSAFVRAAANDDLKRYLAINMGAPINGAAKARK